MAYRSDYTKQVFLPTLLRACATRWFGTLWSLYLMRRPQREIFVMQNRGSGTLFVMGDEE